MFGFFKKSPKASKPSQTDEEYSLEWRNRYLSSRLKFLKDKIEKRGGYVGSIEITETDLKAINAILSEKVEELEQKYRDVKS